MIELTKVQYIQSIALNSSNYLVITIENSAQIIVNGGLIFDCGVLYTNGTLIQGLTDPNNISYEA